MNFFIFYLSIFLTCGIITSLTSAAVLEVSKNFTTNNRHRERRSLIFQTGGQLKLSVGPSMQVNLDDPISWRSLVCSFTVQGGQYSLPTQPIYPWDKWEDTFARSLKHMKRKFEHYGEYKQDESRMFIYNLLEDYMSRIQVVIVDGHQCMLRAICENAQVSKHEGVFAQVLNVVLTPGKEKLNESYTMALNAGRNGADCLKLYYLCPKGKSLLDQYIDETY